MGVTRPTTGTDTTKIKTTAVKRRPLRHQRPEGLDQPHPAQRLMILLARTTPLAEVKKERWHVGSSWSTCAKRHRSTA